MCAKDPEMAFKELKKHFTPNEMLQFFLTVQGIVDVINECGTDEFRQEITKMADIIVEKLTISMDMDDDNIKRVKRYITEFSNVDQLKKVHFGV